MPIFCDYFSDRQIFSFRRDITRGVENLVGARLRCPRPGCPRPGCQGDCFMIVNPFAHRNLSYLDREYDFLKYICSVFTGINMFI